MDEELRDKGKRYIDENYDALMQNRKKRLSGGGLKLNELYVVHHNGNISRGIYRNIKAAYLSRGAARSIITLESADIAYSRFDNFYELSKEERDHIIKEIAETEFKIVTYGPKEEVK